MKIINVVIEKKGCSVSSKGMLNFKEENEASNDALGLRIVAIVIVIVLILITKAANILLALANELRRCNMPP